MLFIIIILIFVLIGLISFFGDYEEKEKARDYRYYNQIINKE